MNGEEDKEKRKGSFPPLLNIGLQAMLRRALNPCFRFGLSAPLTAAQKRMHPRPFVMQSPRPSPLQRQQQQQSRSYYRVVGVGAMSLRAEVEKEEQDDAPVEVFDARSPEEQEAANRTRGAGASAADAATAGSCMASSSASNGASSSAPAPSEARGILITCEHASNLLPPPYRWPRADEWLINSHWSHDIGAATLTKELAVRMGSVAVLSRFSRLLVDPNRPMSSSTLVRTTADNKVCVESFFAK